MPRIQRKAPILKSFVSFVQKTFFKFDMAGGVLVHEDLPKIYALYKKSVRLGIFILTLPYLTVMMTFIGEIMTLDSEQLRRAMRAWTTGVAVVTAKYNDQQYGMTVNSFTSISLEPPLVSVTLKQLTHTHDLVTKSNEFSVTILASHQKELSDRFAGKLPDIHDRFAGLPVETLSIDAPLLQGGLAYFNCRVVNSVPIGENTLFIAEVIAVRGDGEGEPLTYHNRVFWKLQHPSL